MFGDMQGDKLAKSANHFSITATHLGPLIIFARYFFAFFLDAFRRAAKNFRCDSRMLTKAASSPRNGCLFCVCKITSDPHRAVRRGWLRASAALWSPQFFENNWKGEMEQVFDIATVDMSEADRQVIELREKFTGLTITDARSYDEVRRAIRQVVTTRTSLEASRKALKAKAIEFGRKVDAEAERIRIALEEIELPLKAEKQRVDDEREAARKAKEEEERRRIEAELEAKRLAEDQERMKREEEARLERERIAKEQEEERKRLEAERARLEEERRLIEQRRAEEERARQEAMRAEQERLDAERRQMEEERRRLEAERQQIEEQRRAAELEARLKQEREEAAEKARLEEQQRIERERIAAEERARQEAIDAARREAAKPEADRLREYAQRMASEPLPLIKDSELRDAAMQFHTSLSSLVSRFVNAIDKIA